MPAPTIDELTVADAPQPWQEAGFDVRCDMVEIGSVRIRLAGPDAGRGIVGCTMRDISAEAPDGLPIATSTAAAREPAAAAHPNGVVSLDHLVAFSADLERTIAALEDAGLELRRLREEPTPAGAPRQAFFRLAEVILEVIQTPPGSHEERNPDAASRFWGLAFLTPDLDATAAALGDRLGEPRDAVQPGRRIATLRREAGLGLAVAFMSPLR
jgi:Glyoxalase-like domain